MVGDYIPPFKRLYLTPDSIPSGVFCRTLTIPDDPVWVGLVSGVLSELMKPDAWREFGTLTPAESAERWAQMIYEFWDTGGICDLAPYWDEDDAADAEGNDEATGFPWYEELADWVVTAFLATSFTPEAAVQFVTTARQLRLWFRTRDYGAILNIFVDEEPVGTVDTYSEEPGMVEFAYDIPETEGFAAFDAPTWTLRIEHSGTANESATPTAEGFAAEIIRKRIQWSQETQFMLRQNPTNACQLQQSTDGETWTLAFDYSVCVPSWAQTLIDGQNTIQGSLWGDVTIPIQINPNAPVNTWVWRDGETDTESEQRVQALCYAARQAVDIAFDAIIAAYNDQMTLIDATQVVLGILGTLAAVTGVGAWVAFGLAIAIAALEAYQLLEPGDIDILEDDDIRGEVACLILMSIQAKPVTADVLGTALEGQDLLCYDSDTERAIEVMSIMLANAPQRQAIFTGFVEALGQATVAAKAGLIGESCVCPTDSWTYCLPLGEWLSYLETIPSTSNCSNPYNDSIRAFVPDVFSGTPIWKTGANEANSAVGAGRLKMYVPAGTTVTGVSIAWNSFPTTGANSDAVMKRWVVNSSVVCQTSFASNPVVFSSLDISNEVMTLEFSMKDGSINRDFMVQSVTLFGTGVPLFGLCDNC